MKTKFISAIIRAGLVGMVLLVACAPATTVEEPVAEEPVAEEPVAEEPVAEEPVAEEPVAEEPVAEEPMAEEPAAEEDRTLVVLVSDDVPGFDPGQMRHPTGWEIANNLYGSLVSYEIDLEKGTYLADEMIPSILNSWEPSEDRKSLTITINPNATFSDGSPVTAEDVIFTFHRGQVGFSAWQYGLGGMGTPGEDASLTAEGQFEAVDEKTVRINFEEAMGRWTVPNFFFYAFAPISKSFVEANAADDDPWGAKLLETEPLGSGPYVLESWSPGESIILQAREDYWGVQPYYTTLHYRVVPDAQTRLLLMQSGEADIAINLSPDQLQLAEANPDLQVISVPAAQDVVAFRMNSRVPPLDDILVRQAVIKSIPYDAIIEDVIFGYGTRNEGLCGVNTFGYKSFDLYQTDIEGAKELMAQSTYAGGDIPEVELLISTTLPEIAASAILIQDSLRDIGITLNIRELPFNAYYDEATQGNLEVNIHSMGPWYNDCMYWAYWMFSDTPTNHIGFQNSELDRLASESFDVPIEDEDTYSAMIEAVIDDVLVDQAITAPLFERNWNLIAKKDISGIVYWPLQNIVFSHLEPAAN